MEQKIIIITIYYIMPWMTESSLGWFSFLCDRDI